MLCPQWCGTEILWDEKQKFYVNKRDLKRHYCPIAERAKEFMGKYNMIQIKTVRAHIEKLQEALKNLNDHMAYVENHINKKQAEKFDKRKALGNRRNYSGNQ